MNILAVDDDLINRKLLRVQLEAEGYRVLEAANGVEALEVLKREPVDAVISDILMPDMDGFRLCHEIRKSEKISALPFVLYTSTYNSPADRQLAKTVGADDYIIKPAPVPVILNALREATHKVREPWPQDTGQSETYVLKQYSQALVHKLTEKNIELQTALDELQCAHERILDLNKDLDARVQRRTAELEAVNQKLNVANEELEAFSYSVSHDLRAPLRHIDGYARVLSELAGKKLNAEAEACINNICSSAKKMSQLIDDLLAFAHMARREMRDTVVDLNSLVEEAIGSLQAEVQSRHIVWKRSPLPQARGDAVMLRQVFVNLISNAIKYTRPRDPAQIEISSSDENTDVIICVRDNGVGFDMRNANGLFGVFQRLHTDAEFEGTGIGLANVLRIIARHGGRTWAEGAVNVGASFYFTLVKSQKE